MRIGFIGTGHISAAMVEGFCTSGHAPDRIAVSPRNRDIAGALRRKFPCVVIEVDNQSVLDKSEIVVVALRPETVEDVLSKLAFRPGHTVISVVATLPLAAVLSLVHPATSVSRAVPLPSVAQHRGPIACFPDSDIVRAVWSRLGTPVPVGDEATFHALWSLTALLSPYYTLLQEITRWCEERSVERTVAERYVSALFQALAESAADTPSAIDKLARTAATPGGLNAQAIHILRSEEAFAPFRLALDRVFRRLEKSTG